ncbi:MAG TPA: hypothetical protein VF659_08790 [Pyrinomonadaceae bacterium]|jgi:methionine-rich copper-binding protein CopC
MTAHTDIEGEIRRFLLGTLSEDARRRAEERLMAEEGFLEELSLAEGELIDDYVGGRLTAAEREAFERHFLSTEGRRSQLRFTRALGRYADDAAALAARKSGAASSAPQDSAGARLRAFWGGLNWGLRAGAALACVALIAGALWLARPAAPTPRTFAALTLVAGSGDRAAGADIPKARLPLGADALKLTLQLPAGAAPAERYRAELMTSKGRAEAVEVSGPEGRAVTVVVPEARLARGQYAVRLYALGADGAERPVGDSYLFQVE